MIDCTQAKTYWIVFKKGTTWHRFFIKRGYGHCLILTQDRFNWYYCDPTRRQLIIEILSCDPKYNLPNSLRNTTEQKIIKITMNNRTNNWISFFTCFTCVSIVKYILNLKLIAFTPWQLYKRLRKLSYQVDQQGKYGINSITLL